MAEYFKCDSCDALLVGLPAVEAGDLEACPHCGEMDWTGVVELEATMTGSGSVQAEATVIKVGQAVEHDEALPVQPVQTIAPDLVEQLMTPFDPIVEAEPAIEWPTDEEMDRLGIRGDFTAMAILLHAPGDGEPEDHWIAELMIDGHWDYLFRIGTTPDDAIAEAAVRFADYVEKWWLAKKNRRESG